MAAPKKRTKTKAKKKATKLIVSQPAPSPAPAPAKETLPPPATKSPWGFKGMFGLNRWEGLGFWSGVGINYIPRSQTHLRFGFEGTILLVSQGSLSSFLFSSQFLPGRKSFYQEGASLGFAIGPGFSGGGLPQNSTLLVLLAEGAWNEKLSDFVQLQLLLRAGRIGSE